MKSLRFILLMCGMVLCGSMPAWATWYDADFKHKQAITIQNGQVDGNQTNFPVLITEADLDTNFFNHVQKSDLANMDIIFTNASEDTELSREIVHFDSALQQFEAWVKTDLSGSSDTTIYMYYGNPTANKPNSTDTWSNNYRGVWHMQDSPDGSADDVHESTSYANHGSSQGGMSSANLVAGKIQGSLTFERSNGEYLNCGNDSSLAITGALTIMAWINLETTTTPDVYFRILSKKNDSPDADGYGFAYDPQTDGMQFYGVWNTDYAYATTALDTNWHHVAAVINGTAVQFYVDGTAITMGNATSAALQSGTRDLLIAEQSVANSRLFDGEIDEVRVVATNRDSNWISTTYNNQNNPGNFYNVGSELSQPVRYRSIGPGNAGSLETGTGNNMSISGITASFANALGTDVGVGDAVQYDSDDNGSIDAIAFIHGRTNSQTYTVLAANGGIPTPTSAADQDWAIYRAYTSLTDADEGNENIGINSAVRLFDTGNRDIAANDEQWNFALYNDAVDATPCDWDGWTTDSDHYIRIYTPYASNEVGVSQRHQGTWTTGAYRMVLGNQTCITIRDDHVRLEGLQVYCNSIDSTNDKVLDFTGSGSGADVRVSYCILRGVDAGGTDWHLASSIHNSGAGVTYFFNNIIYGLAGTGSVGGLEFNDAQYTNYVYNNTIYGCAYGIWQRNGTVVAVNNIAQSCTDGFGGAFTSSDYNISDLSGDAPGANSQNNVDVVFVDETGPAYDFHLSDSDMLARFSGTDLSGSGINDDIDMESRTINWSVGADENDTPPGTATFTPTASPTFTPTPTATSTSTRTQSPTSTQSATITMTPTMTPSGTITQTATMTPTRTQSATITMTPTITQTLTPSPPWTHTNTPTVTPTPTYTATPSVTPTFTETPTRTITRTITVSPTITQTLTITQTATITQTSTHTPRYVAPDDLANVIIYPNPYRSDVKPEREITFNNVPRRATIRLYNVAGRLVTTLEKDNSLPWIEWDLRNNNGTPVASGIYIYIIKANGQERRGKIAILQ